MQRTGVKLENEYWYQHVPKLTETSHEGKVTTKWNQQVPTDRTIAKNALGITIHNNKENVCKQILQFQEAVLCSRMTLRRS
jgi:hypothetical protein